MDKKQISPDGSRESANDWRNPLKRLLEPLNDSVGPANDLGSPANRSLAGITKGKT
jgi:hypothetical protein